MLVRFKHREPRLLCRAHDLCADARVASLSQYLFVCGDCHIYVLDGLLALLATDDLADIMDALALVRLRLLERADLRRKLPHELLVDTRDRHDCFFGDDLEASWHFDRNRVGKTKRHLDGIGAFHLIAIADAFDLELL